jgi:ketosteroid isomerase-like protein
MEVITAERVRRAVQDFWDAFTHQEKNRFQELYSPTAVCYAADGRRSEPARLMWVRREREFFGPKSSVGAKVGAVSVQILGANVASASYGFHFSIVRILPNGNRAEIEVPYGRATQVFEREPDGRLLIIHEHLSSAEPVTPKEIREPVAARA